MKFSLATSLISSWRAPWPSAGQTRPRRESQTSALRVMLSRLHFRLMRSLSQSTRSAHGNTMVFFGVIGILCHPFYYVLWTFFYPQPFESFWLRLCSALVCVPLIFEPLLSRRALFRSLLPFYWKAMLVYQLPFFFVFMALMNQFSNVWALSTMAACMFLVLLVFDWLLVVLIAVTGSALGAACFSLFGGPLALSTPELSALLMVYFFALLGGSAFNYKSELVANERLSGITSAVATMAHELRTPLLGIRSGAGGLQRYLPVMLEAYELARERSLPVTPIRASHYRELQSVLDRIVAETEYSSTILDILVTNASSQRIDSQSFCVQWIGHCVETALERYPFADARQRDRVRWDSTVDFRFNGSEVLMVHVLFNLLKNALYFLERVDDGCIWVSAERASDGMNRLYFLDNGPGVPPEQVPRLFDRFYSHTPDGTGIGLAFARLVMRSFGGDISCRSEPGRYCEFVMFFPQVKDDEPQ